MPRLDDPDVRVPAAVRNAAAQAEQTHKQFYKKDDAAPPADQAPDQPVEQPAAEAAPAPIADGQAAPAQDPAHVPVTPKGNAGTDWEHKYNSMRGRHDRLSETLRQQSEQIQNLQGLIASMQSTPKETPPELKPESFLTPEEIGNYGPELIDVVKRAAKEVSTPEVKALRQQVKDLESKLSGIGQSMTQDGRTRMHEYLDREMPDWRQINHNPDFIAWLRLPDMYSRAIRQNLLSAAYEQNDAPRVMAFFKGFLADEAATDPEAVVQPDGATPVAKVPLESLAAPGRAKTAANTPAEKPFITSAEIAKFYADRAAGRFRGREKEADSFEREIFRAEREQRIR